MVVGAVVATTGRLGVGRDILRAALRAAVQLAALSAVIVAVVRSLLLSAAFVLLMIVIASLTSARWMTGGRGGLLATGAVLVSAVVLATRVVPVTGVALVPVSGIVIGGSMAATSQAGRRALDELTVRRGE
jgi:putative ABC transport system permease protein